jgi:hypothetical protein
MLFALIYALPILLEEEKSNVYEEAILIVCYTFAAQGFIHLCGYLIPPFGDFLISLHPQYFQDSLLDPKQNIDKFRGMALSGSIYFELPSAYGVAFILFMRLQLKEGQQYLTGYRSYIVFALLIIGIMLTGRTGFVGVGIGLLLYFIFVKDPVVILSRIIRILVIAAPLIIFVWFVVLSSSQRVAFERDVFPFAFEFYYSFVEHGTLSTGSSNVTFQAFYYPLRDETLLLGHGIDNIYDFLHLYTFTDAGYMRTIMFGGIPYLFCLLTYQFLYFLLPIKAASRGREKENRMDLYCFLFLFAYILILHIKDYALGVQHLTEVLFLFIGFSYLVNYYKKIEE